MLCRNERELWVWSMKRLAQKGRRCLLELVSEENEIPSPCNTIPCDEVADGKAPHSGELSCVSDFAESLPRDLNCFRILFNNELSAMARALSARVYSERTE